MTRTAGAAITGIGIVGPAGTIGVDRFRELLRAGKSCVAPVERFDTSPYAARNAALLADFKPRDFIHPSKMRRMNTLSRYAAASARLALDDAAWDVAAHARSAVGIAMGTTFGPVQTSVEYMEEYVLRGASLAPPQLFAESVANAPGSHIAIEYGFEGFNLTFTQRESSALTALTYAAAQIVKGVVSAAFAGGVDEVNEVTFHVLDRIRAISRVSNGSPEEMRPFDVARNGFSIGEGAGGFVLEAPALARSKPYAYIRGYAVGRDATASTSDWGVDAESVAAVMRRALDDAELTPQDVSAIWASANGSVAGDRLEYRAIDSLFASAAPPVVATKGLFGEYAGGGALHLASAAIALRDQFLPATAGFRAGEAAMIFRPVVQAEDAKLEHILINTLSAGGGVVCAVLSRTLE